MSSDLKIKIKQTNGSQQTHEIEISNDNTIQELKLKIEAQFGITPSKQNLIYRGHILFNEKRIEDCQIKSGDTILLVEKMSATAAETNSSPVPQVPLQSGIGPINQINYDLLRQPMGGNVSIEQMEQILSHPLLAGQLDELLKDPQVIKAMMENPAIKPLVDSNPMMKALLSNPEFMKSMFQPENLRMLKNLQQGMNSFPMPGSSDTNANTNQNAQNTNSNPNPNPFVFNPFLMGMGMNNQNPNPFFMNPMGFGQNMNFNQQPQQQLTPEQLKEKYKTQIEQLKEMGFDNEDNMIQALIKTNGNVEAAVERLFYNGGQ